MEGRRRGAVGVAVTAVAMVGLALLAVVAPYRGGWWAFLLALAAALYLLAIVALELRKPLERRWKGRLVYTSLLFMWLLLVSLPIFLYYLILRDGPLDPLNALYFVSVVGLTLTLLYDMVNLPLALYHRRQEDRLDVWYPRQALPMVTFLVPAYNEEACIARTLETLVEVDYPRKEIIVVDDGSTDGTRGVVRRFEGQGVRVFRKENGGKASALNFGLFFAHGDVVVIVDADSLVSRNALREMVARFADPRVKAVCGNIKVLNRNKIITRLQALEYVNDINIAKRAFDVFGSVMVVPGALGGFRRTVLRDGGDYDTDTLTEDFDATLKVLKAGSVVQATSQAVAWTEAPGTLRELYRQRRRWYVGTLQVLIKHRDVLLTPRYGFLGGLGYPYFLISMVFVPLAGFVGLAGAALGIAAGGLWLFLELLGLFVALEFLMNLVALLMDGEELRLAIYSPLFVVGYRTFRDAIRLWALGKVLLGRPVVWAKVARSGAAREMAAD